MELLTHALVGAQAGPWLRTRQLGLHQRLGLGAAAAAFPDIDFLAFPIDPLRFLADWHQGPTHSLLLLPGWAALLAALYCAFTRRGSAFGEAAQVAAFGLASHIVLDALTAYGTQLGWPLSPWRLGLGIVFVVDPLFTLLAAAALAIGLCLGQRAGAAALLALGLYVGALALLQQRALAIAAAAQPQAERIDAIAQPFSPFNWELIAVERAGYQVAHVNLAGHAPLVPRWPGLERWRALAAAYRAPARWQTRPRWGVEMQTAALAQQLWARPDFEPFRRFAAYPALSHVERHAGETCVWFSDLRYDLPALPHTFRYGYCRPLPDGTWRLYRLRYFSDAARQPLD